MMTREQREKAVAEALEWMTEDDPPAVSGQRSECSKFPGWVIDPVIERVLLDCILTMYPQIRLIPVLAAFRMHWFPKGATKPHIWRRRLQNWVKSGAEWDPMISGKSREPRSDHRPSTIGDHRPSSMVSRQSSTINRRSSAVAPVAMSDVVRAELVRIKRIIDG